MAEFPVVDLHDLDHPTKTAVRNETHGFHDWNRDGASVMWGAGMEGLAAFDASDPVAPTLLNSSDLRGVRGVSEYNNLELHGSLRPNAERFTPHVGENNVSVRQGNVVLVSEETLDHDCTDSFQTWYVPHLDAAEYQADNPTGVIGSGTITPLDSWSLLNDTATVPSGDWCSVHWFDYHQDGYVVVPTYDHGTYVLDVNDAHAIRERAHHFVPANAASQSYWVPDRDRRGDATGNATFLAHTADIGDFDRVLTGAEQIDGGIDIFRFIP